MRQRFEPLRRRPLNHVVDDASDALHFAWELPKLEAAYLEMIDELDESASTPEFEVPVKCAELLVRACHAGFFEETQPPGGQ